MNKIEKYLNIFRSYLFTDNKEDIIEELREDIIENLNGDFSDENVIKILKEFGNPRQLALDYSTTKKYLIGPEIYDQFIYSLISTLKLTYLIYFIVAIILYIIQSFVEGLSVLNLLSYIYFLIPVTIIAFLVVLIVFVIIERVEPENNINTLNSNWDVSELDKVAIKDNNFKIGYVITGIVFLTIITLLFIILFTADLSYTDEDNIVYFASFFDNKFNFLIISYLTLNLILETLYKLLLLFKNKYDIFTFIYYIFYNIITLVFSYILYIKLQVIDIQVYEDSKELINTTGSFTMQDVNNVFFSITLLIVIISVINNIYKIYKQNLNK